MHPDDRWPDYDLPFIRRRYNRVAGYFVFFEWLFLLPPGIRRKAVVGLELKRGDRVLEIGCGTGRNLPLLREAVGSEGQIIGVDLSEGMLAEAQSLCDRKKWNNIMLIRTDAADYTSPYSVDAVIFSLSYATMPHHHDVLRHAWKQLRPGGYLVIVDARVPPGLRGKLLFPFAVWIMKRTVLGNPYIRPWEELRELTGELEMREFLMSSYYICRGRKPPSNDAESAGEALSASTSTAASGQWKVPFL
jgi:demethylmenaquinone methyltransferase/2-methoxy-6-polyprenyl-1,4-benzoquinol methylase